MIFLVLAVVTRRFRVPLFWTLLDGPGNSATATRIALMTRYLGHFPALAIRLLLADREFIGTEWLKFLDDDNIRFAIRLREDRFAEGEPPVRPRHLPQDGSELTLFAGFASPGAAGSSRPASARARMPGPAVRRS